MKWIGYHGATANKPFNNGIILNIKNQGLVHFECVNYDVYIYVYIYMHIHIYGHDLQLIKSLHFK